MGVSFYPIKNKKSSSIYSSINYEGIKRFVYKLPNSKIDIKDWGKGELKKGKGLLNNSFLKNLKNEMEDFTRNSDLFLKEFIRINKRLPTKFDFYDFYKSMKPSDDYFNTNKIFLILPIFEDIVESRKSGKLLKKGGIRYDLGTIKTYKNTLDSLRGYIEY